MLVDALAVAGPAGDAAREELRSAQTLEVPVIFGAEAASALRALVSRGQLDADRAAAALEQICSVRANRYPFEPFARRAWQLRDNLTVYDAWYIALAEWLDTELVTADTELVTADTALQSAPGPTCAIRRPDEHA